MFARRLIPGFEVRMIEDRGADCQLPLEQHRQPNVLLCALRAKIAVVRIGVPNGGYFAQVRKGSVALRDGLPVRSRAQLAGFAGGRGIRLIT